MKRKQYKVSEAQIPMFDFDHPYMPVLDVNRCEARLINYETAARMVETYHYAHRVPSIVVAVGMFVDGTLAGCATYGTIPVNNSTSICGDDYKDNVLELTRLFIFDWCGKNSESWLIGRTFNLLEKHYPRYSILISYSDTKQNHSGYVYQATNWIYTGCSIASVKVLSDGTMIHSRSTNDTRKKLAGNMVLDSATFKELHPDAVTEIQPPKHRYIYFLGNKRQRRELREALKWPVLPYPKGVTNEI